ncbi:MAG: hypothetical protein NTZ25_00925 [Candidatus Peregrinibacteria bacterium]|nr:hypothetical protein [Candidatus Peregrinibacteria bacterium]
MSNNEEGNDFHDIDEGFHGHNRINNSAPVDHTGPAISGFTRTPGRSDGAFTTIFESVRSVTSGMYDSEADNY